MSILQDLPIIPCYNNNNCGTVCNDGLLPPNCIRGNDANFCQGIMHDCDKDKFDCNTNTNNPGEADCLDCTLGCNINSDNVQEKCLEFERKDSVFTGCDDICWDIGGHTEINNKCNEMFKDENSCNAMRYFCKWDSNKNICGTFENDTSPRDNYINTIGISPPKNPVILPIKETCSSTINPSCIKATVPEDEEWNLKCSQSSWSSTTRTSYAKNSYICCLEKCNTKTGICKKDCITTPRCQFVDEACDCCFKNVGNKNDQFACAMVQNNNLKKGYGYCTWCNGQCTNTRSTIKWVEDKRINKIHAHENGDEWVKNGECVNRCSNLNLCEAENSEILWNKCIWEESNHTLGVNPEKVNNINDVRTIQQPENGTPLCIKDTCIKDCNGNDTCINNCNFKNKIANVCRDKIFPKSFNKAIIDNQGTDTKLCSESGSWINMCTGSNNAPVSTNFYCDICPSLKCLHNNGTPVNSLQDCITNCGDEGGGEGGGEGGSVEGGGVSGGTNISSFQMTPLKMAGIIGISIIGIIIIIFVLLLIARKNSN